MKQNSTLPIISLMGPTAAGKTATALALAQRYPCEIISVDSALIYKGMDIGTAKPTVAEQASVPHWLIDIRDPAQAYSVSEFCHAAASLIDDIQARQRIPLLVGGTMMYFNALVHGISARPSADATCRADIEQEAAQRGWLTLHQELMKVDPLAAARIHPNDPQRLTRALEVWRTTGRTLTEWQQSTTHFLRQPVTQFAILPDDRAVLHARIEDRFKQMLTLGFIDEVRTLYHRKDLHLDLPAIRSVGYRQVWQYLDGQLSYDEMVQRGIIATRQLAKRQLTWLRNWENLICLTGTSKDNLTKIMSKVTL